MPQRKHPQRKHDQHKHRQRVKLRERWILLAILLIAWALRWSALMDAPPGWRDDDLIEVYTFSQRILESGPRLYFTGASGHEPLYHTIRAPLLAVAGVNQASVRWLAASAGMLSVLLTWAVGRQILSRDAGLLSAAMLALCFWNLMYSRVAIRHIAALPWMLVAIYGAWRELTDDEPHPYPLVGIAIGTAGAMLTYYAGRLMPALLLVTLPVLWINVRRWPRFLSALGAGVLIAAPMFIAAANTPGADARVSEVAAPLHALAKGNLKPVMETTLTTLSMFHATGDPEWLYNISQRPVFGALGATLFAGAVLFQLVTLNQRRSRFLLLWLVTGLSPAFISLPPSSYGHTVLAMPAVYLIMAGLIVFAREAFARTRRSNRILAPLVVFVCLIAVGGRDLPDYFIQWSNHSMVEFLYRADYRALARHLDDHREIESAVVGSLLYGPWDKVAVETDLDRDMPHLRWVNPARALIFTSGPSTRLYLQHEGQRHPIIQSYLEQADPLSAPMGMEGFQLPLSVAQPEPPYLTEDCDGQSLADQPFDNTLSLSAVEVGDDKSTEHMTLTLWWDVRRRPSLPSEQLIPNPPPPGVYRGPRSKVFVHSAHGSPETVLDVDDGMGVDPYTLREGDIWVQVHELKKPESQRGNPRIRIGVYDPKNGSRWTLPDGRDAIWICVYEGQ